jgi:hypothetical protein
MAIEPGCPFYAQPPLLRGLSHSPRRQGDDAAGYAKIGTKDFDRFRVSQRFFRRPYTVFYMDTMEDKTPFPAGLRQGGKHGSGVGSPGYRSQKRGSLFPVSQTGRGNGFKFPPFHGAPPTKKPFVPELFGTERLYKKETLSAKS